MKTLIIPLSIALVVGVFAFTSSAFAQESKPKTLQQQKFADCAHQSKGMKGNVHRKFMSDCLSGKTHEMKADAVAEGSTAKEAESKANETKNKTTSAMTAQREKIKACNAEAKSKNLTGEERKTFMSECLKGDGK